MVAPTRAAKAPITPATGAFLKAASGVKEGVVETPAKAEAPVSVSALVLLALGVLLEAGAEVEEREGVSEYSRMSRQ
jgi:hypothetical protein